ncbi:uncharacterized protein LOC117643692 isoform X1 [Thrips palmi]|uniref:Uncharacterized protein LOC117643692 isoform X1 n=1 Tax=Thrips palmi TaxID=161013 RepID=A0A6P8YFW1_THRPL|nr:uncharacterized protein LOC117643692 isoform X1 [Thrips palmi]
MKPARADRGLGAVGTVGVVCMALFALLPQASETVKVTALHVPSHVAAHSPAHLVCHQDLEGSALYTVKWFKNGREFFRFAPFVVGNPKKYFDTAGVDVDMVLSNQTHLVLRDVSRLTTGRFKCEISGEGPDFKTASESAEMSIVVPSGPPVISGTVRDRFHVGEEVNINCTSSDSYPAADLVWYINDMQVPRSHLKGPYFEKNVLESLETSILNLSFRVLPHHFQDTGEMSLRCVATLHAVYRQEDVQSFLEEKQPRPPALESRGPNKNRNRENEVDDKHYKHYAESSVLAGAGVSPVITPLRGLSMLMVVVVLVVACLVN